MSLHPIEERSQPIRLERLHSISSCIHDEGGDSPHDGLKWWMRRCNHSSRTRHGISSLLHTTKRQLDISRSSKWSTFLMTLSIGTRPGLWWRAMRRRIVLIMKIPLPRWQKWLPFERWSYSQQLKGGTSTKWTSRTPFSKVWIRWGGVQGTTTRLQVKHTPANGMSTQKASLQPQVAPKAWHSKITQYLS